MSEMCQQQTHAPKQPALLGGALIWLAWKNGIEGFSPHNGGASAEPLGMAAQVISNDGGRLRWAQHRRIARVPSQCRIRLIERQLQQHTVNVVGA
jgi:hypothetical protein